MATLYTLHPDNPQPRLVQKIVDELRSGAVMLYPTDTVYAIGCDLNSKSAIQRVRQLKQLSNDKPLTFLCPSLSNIAQYAVVSDTAYRVMRNLVPGTFTFLLPASRLVPKMVMNPKRKTSGIRVPDHPLCQALLAQLGNPIISTSANVLEEDEPSGMMPTQPLERAKLFDYFERMVDVIVDDGSPNQFEVSTILDLTSEEPAIVRRGLGWEAATAWALE